MAGKENKKRIAKRVENTPNTGELISIISLLCGVVLGILLSEFLWIPLLRRLGAL